MQLKESVVKKWRARTQKGDLAPSKRGRPQSGSLSTFPDAMGADLVALRRQKPGMGPIQLLLGLKGMPRWAGDPLPSRAAVARFLAANGLSRTYSRHAGVVTIRGKEPERPHDCWQMDAKGNTILSNLGTIALIDLKDWRSKAYCMSYPAVVEGEQGHPTTRDYQHALRLAFIEFGLPQAIQVDHESVFYDNRSKSPFPTRLHLWLIALGINLLFTRLHRPTDNGIVERSHRTLFEHVIKGRNYPSWISLMNELNTHRTHLNCQTPCATLGGISPFKAFPAAKLPQKMFDPVTEATQMKLARVYDYLQGITCYRKVSKGKTVSLAKEVYYLAEGNPGEEVTISFNRERLMLCFQHDKERAVEYHPIKSLSVDFLMGESFFKAKRPSIQLPIPLETNIQQMYYELRFNETKTVTI